MATDWERTTYRYDGQVPTYFWICSVSYYNTECYLLFQMYRPILMENTNMMSNYSTPPPPPNATTAHKSTKKDYFRCETSSGKTGWWCGKKSWRVVTELAAIYSSFKSWFFRWRKLAALCNHNCVCFSISGHHNGYNVAEKVSQFLNYTKTQHAIL